ncbi:tetratricopeptide repeat protein [Thalassospiraceae bacterium LMO-SO8]|nr:tetratricopeptide repeat protein [Alphaproteobacteria bacterium LMO-S08]WND75841.1 tetratricopeptide repeat protein [Thalassospiraceae bacterium LMO-SO8]
MTAPSRTFRRIFLAATLLSVAACATDKVPTPDEIKQDNADSRARQLVRVGDASRAGGDSASALAFYQRAQAMRPDWDEPYRRTGETALALGMAEEAAAAYTRLTTLAPDDAAALLGLGQALVALDRPAEAADAFTRAQAAAPKDHRPLNGLGIARDLAGDHAGAQDFYRRGLALAPDSLSLKNNLGLSLALSGAYAEAIRVLGDAAKSPGAGPRGRQNLALVYGLSGDTDRAAKIGRLDLTESQVQSNLRRYEALRKLSDKARARAVHTGQGPDG